MIDPKTAPDPQIGSNPELLAQCLALIEERRALSLLLDDLREKLRRKNAVLRGLSFSLQDEARHGAFGVTAEAYGEAMRLSDKADDGYAD